jgi:hypothetical protein
MVFPKSAAIWVFVLVGLFAAAMLIVLYLQGGIAHVVHQ